MSEFQYRQWLWGFNECGVSATESCRYKMELLVAPSDLSCAANGKTVDTQLLKPIGVHIMPLHVRMTFMIPWNVVFALGSQYCCASVFPCFPPGLPFEGYSLRAIVCWEHVIFFLIFQRLIAELFCFLP